MLSKQINTQIWSRIQCLSRQSLLWRGRYFQAGGIVNLNRTGIRLLHSFNQSTYKLQNSIPLVSTYICFHIVRQHRKLSVKLVFVRKWIRFLQKKFFDILYEPYTVFFYPQSSFLLAVTDFFIYKVPFYKR